MKKIGWLLSLCLIILSFQYCSTKKKDVGSEIVSDSSTTQQAQDIADHNITIYGSKTCPHCVAFLKKMESENIPFDFKDVDEDQSNFDEMYAKIKEAKYSGYINYPVVDLDGKIMVRPEFEELMELLRH